MTVKWSEAEFVKTWYDCGSSPTKVAVALGTSQAHVYKRRARLAARGTVLPTIAPERRSGTVLWAAPHNQIPQRLEVGIDNGVVVVFSDAHYWPNRTTVAHKALIEVIRQLRPAMVVANGDVLDGATISRHDPNQWETKPTLLQEITECKERLGEVEDAAGVDCRLIWTFGNHDLRFERVLATKAPQFEGLLGTTLADHFPRWDFTMSAMVNPRGGHPIMVKHRYANGVHATYNNTVKAGISIVTGHLHRLNVTCWGDYRGRRYGVDTGTLAEPQGPQFTYAEDAPSPHGSGFAVLTIVDGDLLPPELCEVRGDFAYFRGARV